MNTSKRILMVPGLGNSGPEHWQSLWEAEEPGFWRVEQRDWEAPDCRAWVLRLEETVAKAGPEVVIAAHSLGCATVVHWALQSRRTVQGAFLVAPSDVEAPWYREAGLTGCDPMPLQRLPFPSLIVASSNDPYLSVDRARELARAWGSGLVEVGDAGHLNTASGHGP